MAHQNHLVKHRHRQILPQMVPVKSRHRIPRKMIVIKIGVVAVAAAVNTKQVSHHQQVQ